jgi:hypothetical protein
MAQATAPIWRLSGTSSKQFGHKAMLQLTKMRHVMQWGRREELRKSVPTASEHPAAFEGEFSNVTSSYAGKGVVRYSW